MGFYDFYTDQTLVLTGATGFLGKYLLYKLLKCANLKAIYVIIRGKKGKSHVDRLAQLKNNEMFRGLENQFENTVRSFDGDTSLPRLGLSQENYETITKEATIFIHSAAYLNMTAALKEALKENVYSTNEVIDLALKCTHLKIFVHVSTLFTFPQRPVTLEDIPETDFPPEMLMGELTDDKFKFIEERAKNYGPTYNFSKSLAEVLVKHRIPHEKCIIARPAVIYFSIREPEVGWMAEYQIPHLLSLAYFSGLLQIPKENLLHFPIPGIPADLCGNAILASLPYKVAMQSKEVDIYNLAVNKEALLPITTLLRKFRRFAIEYPSKHYVRLPNSSFTKKHNQWTFTILRLYHEILPAHVLDLITRLVSKTKPRAVEFTHKIHKMLTTLESFLGKNAVNFDNDNFNKLWKWACEQDSELIMDDLDHDFTQTSEDVYLTFRKSMLKEPLTNLDQVKSRYKLVTMFSYLVDWLPAVFGVGFSTFLYTTVFSK